MSEQIILTLRRLVKRYPPDRTVLDGITLAFLHGAKIGVLGANGSGKSSLLRIMAGIDTHVGGDVLLAPGATVGMLDQELRMSYSICRDAPMRIRRCRKRKIPPTMPMARSIAPYSKSFMRVTPVVRSSIAWRSTSGDASTTPRVTITHNSPIMNSR